MSLGGLLKISGFKGYKLVNKISIDAAQLDAELALMLAKIVPLNGKDVNLVESTAREL